MFAAWLLIASALAAEPLVLPLMVPARPDPGVPSAPDVSAFGWRSAPGVGFRVDMRLGDSIAVAPFTDLGAAPRCDCDAAELTCAVLDDGSLHVRLTDPTRPRPRADLGACTVGAHTLDVRGVPPALPPPFEAEPGRWVVPVRPGQRGAVDVIWLPRVRGWTPIDGTCGLEPRGRRDALVRLLAPVDAWTPCLAHRSGRDLEVRTLTYRMPWEPTPVSATPTSAPPPEPTPEPPTP